MAAEPVTLLFTDLVNSTEPLQRVGDEQAQRVLRAHHQLLRDAVQGGCEVKRFGDGLMTTVRLVRRCGAPCRGNPADDAGARGGRAARDTCGAARRRGAPRRERLDGDASGGGPAAVRPGDGCRKAGG